MSGCLSLVAVFIPSPWRRWRQSGGAPSSPVLGAGPPRDAHGHPAHAHGPTTHAFSPRDVHATRPRSEPLFGRVGPVNASSYHSNPVTPFRSCVCLFLSVSNLLSNDNCHQILLLLVFFSNCILPACISRKRKRVSFPNLLFLL